MPPLEGDEGKVRKGKGIKILTLNKLLTRRIYQHNKSWKQFIQTKMSDKCYIFHISIIKLLRNFTTI